MFIFGNLFVFRGAAPLARGEAAVAKALEERRKLHRVSSLLRNSISGLLPPSVRILIMF